VSDRDRVGEAIARNDIDELIRIVDDLAERGGWDDVLGLRDRARGAFDDTGRQLWPAASWAEYRVALHGPDDLLDEVLDPGAGLFAPGPLTEVAAQHHHWLSVASHLPEGPTAALFAHECAARGEVIEDLVPAADVLGIPLIRARWEPEYLLPEYSVEGVEAADPEIPFGRELALPPPGASLDDDDALDAIKALRAVVQAWSTQSDAIAVAVAVDGDVGAAIAACGGSDPVRVAPLSPQEALIWLAWAGASGGAHGRRRGAAAGRDIAWHAVAAICGFDPHTELDADELGEAIEELRWCWWQSSDALTGHVLRIAAEDPVDGVAFAISAVDPAASDESVEWEGVDDE
jgi:hypothetical protein